MRMRVFLFRALCADACRVHPGSEPVFRRAPAVAMATMTLAAALFGCGTTDSTSNTPPRGNGGAGGQAGSSSGAGGGQADSSSGGGQADSSSGAGAGGSTGVGKADAGGSSDADASVDAVRDTGSMLTDASLDRSTPSDASAPGTDGTPRLDVVVADGSPDVPPPIVTGCDAVTAHMRADRSIAQLMFGFWNGTTQYFDAAEPTTNNRTGYWTFAQAFDAVIDGVERTGSRRYRGLIQTLYSAQNGSTWRSDYYDDENWLALALMRAYDLTGNRAYLDRALALFLEITAAWDSTSAHPGGIWWDRAHTQKATASNAGPVITGVRLSARTGDPAHLTFARQVYDFWFTNMTVAATYEVRDHMNPDGTIAAGRLTYNEGLMSGAALALHAATGEARFRTEAHGFAGRLAKVITKTTPVGRVLADGTNTSCTGDCPQWKGIGYRYLAAAFRDDPSRPEYLPVLQASVEAAWTLARSTTTGYFANDWAGPPMATASIEAQSSTAMAMNLLAMLCGSFPAPPDTAYEAEDAVLDHVGLEETNAGFSGWGYVSSWTANNQFVEFVVTTPAAGSYKLDFGYAAASSEATRSLSVNGAMALPRIAFPPTGAWTTWGRTSVNVQLAAGANAIRLIYQTANGGANPLNLDQMIVTPI
jgi:predicted alpha-1,6-mannanase (GH76 family)